MRKQSTDREERPIGFGSGGSGKNSFKFEKYRSSSHKKLNKISDKTSDKTSNKNSKRDYRNGERVNNRRHEDDSFAGARAFLKIAAFVALFTVVALVCARLIPMDNPQYGDDYIRGHVEHCMGKYIEECVEKCVDRKIEQLRFGGDVRFNDCMKP